MTQKKILLGVDPFSEDTQLLEKQAIGVEAIFKNEDILVEPIYVVNPRMLSWSDLLAQQGWERYEKSLIKRIKCRLAKTRMPSDRLLTPVIVLAPSVTTRGQVASLLEHAKRSRSDLIVVSSHSRKGIKRVFLGSFAETLSLRTDLPLLVINPRQRLITSQFRLVLFPTDLSEESKRGLDSLIVTMQGMWEKVVLFHQVEPVFSLAVEPFTSIPIPRSEIERDWKRREEILGKWVNYLQQKGIEASFKLNKIPAPVAEGILTAAMLKKVGMIAMVSEAGPLESAFLGSTTRKIMRASFLPVWTIHVRSVKEAKTPVEIPKETKAA